MIKNNILTIIGLLLILACAQNLAAQKQESLDGDQIKFTLPEGFTSIEKTNLDFRFYFHAPKKIGCCLDEKIYAYSNKSKSMEVMLTFVASEKILGTEEIIEEKLLPKIKRQAEKSANQKIKGLKWLKKENILQNEKKWIHLNFQTPKTDDDRVYDILLADYHGYLMIFAVSVDASEYVKNKASMTEIINSLKVDEAGYGAPMVLPD